MKLKVAAIAGAVFACGLHGVVDQAWIRALTDGAEAKLIFHIVDQDGNPVPDAHVRCGFWRNYSGGGPLGFDLTTDKNGICAAKGTCTGPVAWTVAKDGYYNSSGEWKLSETEAKPKVSGGKWQPYGSTRTIVLKKIENPVPMADSIGSKYSRIPAFGKWIGYDMQERCWVEPWGDGRHADMLLKFENGDNTAGRYFRSMEVSFTNNPYAGGYVLDKDGCSQFESVYHADTNASYASSFLFTCRRPLKDRPLVINNLGKDQYMVFRTRTKVDYDGRLISAHYGKLYGEWKFFEKNNMAIGRVVLNPTPNDTNLEVGQKR